MQKRIYDYRTRRSRCIQATTHNFPRNSDQLDRPKIARMIGRSLAWVAEEQEHKRMRQLFAPSLTSVFAVQLSDFKAVIVSHRAEIVRNGAQHVLDAAENVR
jgi:hypothetical protein